MASATDPRAIFPQENPRLPLAQILEHLSGEDAAALRSVSRTLRRRCDEVATRLVVSVPAKMLMDEAALAARFRLYAPLRQRMSALEPIVVRLPKSRPRRITCR